MKLYDITALTVKIAGLVLFVIVLSKIPEYVKSYASVENSQYTTSSFYYILPLLIVAIACIILFLFPYRISNHLLFKSESSSTPDNLTNQFQVVAIRLLGLLLLFWAVSDIVFHIFNYLMMRDLAGVTFPVSAYNYPLIVATGAEILFAYVLLTKAKTISLYLNSVGK